MRFVSRFLQGERLGQGLPGGGEGVQLAFWDVKAAPPGFSRRTCLY